MDYTALQSTNATGVNITTIQSVATYTPTTNKLVRPKVRISSLNGAAATFTVGIRNTTDSMDLVVWSSAKRLAADTSAGFVFPSFYALANKAYAILLLSTNASDTSTQWDVDWFDVGDVNAGQFAGVATATSGTTGDITAVRGGTLATTTNITAGTIGSVTNAVLVQSGTASGQLNVTGGVVQADLAKWLGVEPESLNNGFVGVNVQEIFGVPIAVTGTVNSIAFASGETVAYVGSEVIANVSKIQGETINMGGTPGDGLLMTAGQTIGSSTLTAGQVRTELATELARIDVATSTRLAAASYTAAPTAAANADAVWDEARSGHTTNGTYGAVSEWATSSGLTAQQVRDAMALTTTANAASGSIDNKLDGIKVKTDTISGTGDVVTARRARGYIEIVQSTANLNSTGTPLPFEKASSDTGWPSDLLSNGGYAVSFNLIPTNGGTTTVVTGGVVVDASNVRIDIPASTTANLTPATSAGPNYKYQVWATTGTTNPYCLALGDCRVIDDIRS